MEEKQRRKSRMQMKRNRQKRTIHFIRYIILLTIMIILSYMGYGMYREAKVGTRLAEENTQNEQVGNLEENKKNNENRINEKNIKIPSIPVVQKYSGYQVDSRLEIPKIDLNTNVLTNYSTEGLEVCASKYYGPQANEVGNYCIAAHNYNKKNMFNHLIDLELKDTILLTDNKNGIVEYEVYDIYKVKPENVEPLSQETDGKKELTLITCVNYSKNRLVIKAVQKVENRNLEKLKYSKKYI